MCTQVWIHWYDFLCRDAGSTEAKAVVDTSGCGGARPKTAPQSTAPDAETPPLPPPRNL